jgi:tetratricopeptide (TPR) repeat protein
MSFEGYYPHYYLGLAYYKNGNFAAAATEFAESERQGAIRSNAELYSNLRKIQASLGSTPPPQRPVQEAAKEPPKKEEKKPEEKKPADAPKSGADPAVIARAVNQARTELARSQELQIAILGKKDERSFTPVWQHDPRLQESYALALQKLNKAKTTLQDGISKGEVTDIDAATSIASSAGEDLVKLQGAMAESKAAYDKSLLAAKPQPDQTPAKVAAADLLKQKQDEQDKRAKEKAEFDRQQVARQLQRRVSSANAVLGMLDKAGNDPALTRSKGEIRQLVQRFSVIGPNGAITDLRALGDRLSQALSGANEMLTRIAASSGGPPPALVDAAASFFSGDYQRTISVLDKASFGEARATAQALLLRAAARYALFMVSGGKDEKLRALAAADAGECHRRDPKLTPARTAFSPGFADFFRRNS